MLGVGASRMIVTRFDSRIALWYSEMEFYKSVSGGFLWKSTAILRLRMYMTN